MLGFILVLALFNSVVYARTSPAARSGAVASLFVTAMLLLNHVSSSFLSDRWRRRMIVPQFAFIGLTLFYVLSLMKR
jgi:hypothetical protein